MKFYLQLFILITCLGCNKNKQKGLVYFNDFESIKGWTETQLVEKPAHSGNYANELDAENRFGNTFKLTLKEISEHPVKKLKVKFWAYLPDGNVKGKFVIEINQPDKKNLFWTAKDIQEYVKVPEKWTEIILEFNFTNNEIMLPENSIKIFPWNLSGNAFYVDDMRLEFFI